MLGGYLTVTSIGVRDGGECFYPTQTIEHVSNRQSAYQHKPCKGLTPTVGATD